MDTASQSATKIQAAFKGFKVRKDSIEKKTTGKILVKKLILVIFILFLNNKIVLKVCLIVIIVLCFQTTL